ncbi:BZ3500_MvSof-1268-A1-R1_Chr1-3g02126 [Microbotryum saponariae]|uniref:Mitochondrial genome maintenance protein MGM101 n=1 Tax=Microbotryum saponariae TaxID=289078 RepID=A0A2X0L982_9BASI|nr:BZ3500_MvSof-1268-A1-R1_Chr1-3g02126 [Microbotryum saponariae]SCZ95461.1 BZ3501_MvSof-1269-A2-R1_Chr1-3g01728 [Microbotryum saponariae]
MPTSHLARRALQRGLLHARSASTASTGAPARRPYVRASAKTAAATTPAPAAAPNATAASSAVPTPVAADSSSSPDAFFDSHIDIGEMMLDGPAVPSAERVASPSSSTSSAGFSSSSSFGSSTLPSNNAIPSSTSIPISTSALDSMIPSAPAASSFGAIGDQARDIDWTTSFHGMSAQPFSEKAAKVLMRPLEVHEVEIKPDGLLYLPEILYRRFLNQALGPGGWGMVPRGELTVMNRMVSREWGLVAGGRLVSVARGEQAYFDPSGLATATEGCKSNALMRCCKDLGIASELWDPSFIRKYKSEHCVEVWTEHVTTKKKQKRWRKKGNKFEYPLTEARA